MGPRPILLLGVLAILVVLLVWAFIGSRGPGAAAFVPGHPVVDEAKADRPQFIRAALAAGPLDPAFARAQPLILRRLTERRTAPPSTKQILELDRHEDGPDQVRWEDKAWMIDRHASMGLPHAKTYYLGVPSSAEALAAVLQKRSRYVAKPTHLSESDHVIVFEGGRNLLTGELFPTPLAVAQRMMEALEARPQPFENWALGQVRPQVLVEELLDAAYEIKYWVVWGRVVGGKVVQKPPPPPGVVLKKNRWDYRGAVSRSGLWAPNPSAPVGPPLGLETLHRQMIEAVEEAAAGADLIRIDTYVAAGGSGGMRFYMGELTAPPFGAFIGAGFEDTVRDLLLDGHEARLYSRDARPSPHS
jgi:hypothetical protein